MPQVIKDQEENEAEADDASQISLKNTQDQQEQDLEHKEGNNEYGVNEKKQHLIQEE